MCHVQSEKAVRRADRKGFEARGETLLDGVPVACGEVDECKTLDIGAVNEKPMDGCETLVYPGEGTKGGGGAVCGADVKTLDLVSEFGPAGNASGELEQVASCSERDRMV